jgi:large subunit ribosomal protein L15
MDLSNIQPAKGAVKKEKRIGRGEGSGHGGTSTRGHKGAGSRSGYSRKIGFEGGQMPLYRRIPKFGFKNNNKIVFRAINVEMLQKLSDEKGVTSIDLQVLMDNSLIGHKDLVKILSKGEINTKMEVKAHAFSKEAIRKIEEKGGSAIKI